MQTNIKAVSPVPSPPVQIPVNTIYLVVRRESEERYLYMETVWTKEAVETHAKFKVISEHPTKDDARVECERLNDLVKK